MGAPEYGLILIVVAILGARPLGYRWRDGIRGFGVATILPRWEKDQDLAIWPLILAAFAWIALVAAAAEVAESRPDRRKPPAREDGPPRSAGSIYH